MLGFDAPTVPNGEVLDAARELKPELAKAEGDVSDFWFRSLSTVVFGEVASDVSSALGSVDVLLRVSE